MNDHRQGEPERRCIVCRPPRRRLAPDEPQTCRRCALDTLRHLATVELLYPLLTFELHGRVGAAGVGPGDGERFPFGDLLSLIGPGAETTAGPDAQPNDSPSVSAALASWEDDWRQTQRQPGAPGPASVPTAAAYLRTNHAWAANWHPAYDEFAADMRDLSRRMLAALRLVDTPAPTPVHCIDWPEGADAACGGRLVRDYDPPRPCVHRGGHRSGCDQGGLRDEARCEVCGRVYSQAEYHVAYHDQLAAAREAAALRKSQACDYPEASDVWHARIPVVAS